MLIPVPIYPGGIPTESQIPPSQKISLNTHKFKNASNLSPRYVVSHRTQSLKFTLHKYILLRSVSHPCIVASEAEICSRGSIEPVLNPLIINQVIRHIDFIAIAYMQRIHNLKLHRYDPHCMLRIYNMQGLIYS